MIKKEVFCKEDCALANKITQLLLNEVFGESLKDEIKNRYNDMRNNYDCDYNEWQERFTTKGKPFKQFSDTTAICIHVKDTKFPELLNFNRIGLDLPTWVNINDNENSTIMFVAQDPLRSECYDNCHDIVVSSPFATHDSTHRMSRNGIVYYNIFSELVNMGFGIYLTDIYKFYLKGDKSNSFTKAHKGFYNEMLHKEIEIVNPKLIVAFGKKANFAIREFVSNYNSKVPYLALPHPSGTNRGYIKKTFDLNDISNESIIKEFIARISNKCENI